MGYKNKFGLVKKFLLAGTLVISILGYANYARAQTQNSPKGNADYSQPESGCKGLEAENKVLRRVESEYKNLETALEKELADFVPEKNEYSFLEFKEIIGTRLSKEQKENYWKSLDKQHQTLVCRANSKPVLCLYSIPKKQRQELEGYVNALTPEQYNAYRAKYPWFPEDKKDLKPDNRITIYGDKIIEETEKNTPIPFNPLLLKENK